MSTKNRKLNYDILFYIANSIYAIALLIVLKKLKSFWLHFFEFYSTSIIIHEFLTKFDFESIRLIFQASIKDRIGYLTSQLLFLFFKPDIYLFFVGKILYNFILFFILYKGLKKIISKRMSFFIILLLMSSNLFIIESLNSYINSIVILNFACFFVYLKIILTKNKKITNIIILFILSILLFLTKAMTLIVIPIVFLFLIFYVLFEKKNKTNLLILLGIFIAGLLPQLWIYNFNIINLFFSELHMWLPESIMSNSSQILTSSFLSLFFNKIIQIFSNLKFSYLLKFNSIFLTIVLYSSIIFYMILKNREKYWIFFFFGSEFYLFLVNNFSGEGFETRFMYPFYFVYFVLIVNFLYELVILISTKFRINKQKIIQVFYIFLIFLILFNLGSITTTIISKNLINKNEILQLYNSHNYPISLFNVPINSTIYFEKTNQSCLNHLDAVINVIHFDNEEVKNRLDLIPILKKYSLSQPRFNFSFKKIDAQEFKSIEINDYFLVMKNKIINKSSFKWIQDYNGPFKCQLLLFKKIK